MSAKQSILERVKSMSDVASWEEILQQLAVPTMDVIMNPEYTLDEPSEDEWREIMAHAFADELADPREDIYAAELLGKSK